MVHISARRGLPLLLVAVALLGVAPVAHGREHGRTGSFLALSYNVAGLPQGISGSDPATNSPLISQRLDGYDLVLLQENWQDPLHEQRQAEPLLDELVPPIMYHHVVVRDAHHRYRSEPAPHPYGSDVSRAPTGPPLISDGLNRLSRFEFRDVTRVMWNRCHGEFHFAVVEAILGESGLDDAFDDAGLGVVNDETDGGAADCGAQKGFSVARTALADGVTVDVYNLHADAGSGQDDQAAREDNFVQLAAYILEHSDGHAVILGGDTNLHTDRADRIADARVWRTFLADTGLSDVCDVVNCKDDAGAIDKFAFRSGGGVELIPQKHSFEVEEFTHDGEPLSDHDPLAVRFRWVAPGRR